MKKSSVLLAGSDSSYMQVSKKLLKSQYNNLQVDFAYSGIECIKKASSKQYDLVLFDFELEEKNGLQVIEEIGIGKQKPPLIMLIDEGDEIKAVRALELGASDYILKTRGYLSELPFTVSKFLGVDNLLESDRTVKQRRDSNQTGHFVLDSKLKILSASHNMKQVTNFSEAELLELNFVDLLPDEQQKLFFSWLNSLNGKSGKPFTTEIIDKTGNKIRLDIDLTAIKDQERNVVRYEGQFLSFGLENQSQQQLAIDSRVDQLSMISQMANLVTTGNDLPLNAFLERIIEIACQLFRFERATVAFLDKKRKVFVKQAMIGYHSASLGKKNLEVPEEVIQRVFANRYRVKAIYYNQDHRNALRYLNAKKPERRSQKRRPSEQWHPRDLILANLMNRSGETFGYISLDKPVKNFVPNRDTFNNVELFGQLTSMAIENWYQFSTLEKRSRRLKQILVTSNIFKLYLSLNELLKEVVWSIKFSLDFNMVALGLISKKSQKLEIKAVACDDKIKRQQITTLSFPLNALATLFRTNFNTEKSYFVQNEDIFQNLKSIYYGTQTVEPVDGRWPYTAILLVPIKSREGKIIGSLLVDDPGDNRMPTKETVHILEIMANQIGVAIDNRILYIQAKQKLLDQNGSYQKTLARNLDSPRLKRFVDRLFG